MDCLDARPFISAAMDGEPAPDGLDDHLARCSECRTFRADMHDVRRSLRMGPVVPPPDVVGAVLPRVAATEHRSTTKVRIGLIAATAACVGLGLMLVDDTSPRPRASVVELSADQSILVAWTADPLPDRFGDQVVNLGQVRSTTTADLGLANLRQAFDAEGTPITVGRRSGVVPIEVLGYDPDTYPAFASALHREQLSALEADEVILSDSAAQLRGGLTPGDTLLFESGQELTVAALVPESDIAAAEMAVTETTADDLRPADDSFILVEHDGDAEQIRAEMRDEWTDLDRATVSDLAVVPVKGLAYLRGRPDSTPHLVLKERFGEFTFVPYDEEHSVPDPDWVAANVASATIAPLGTIRCQADTLASLATAMAQIVERDLDALIDPTGRHRCWEPLADNSDIDASHLWGIAVELDLRDNVKVDGHRYRDLVSTMHAAGFQWGGHPPDNHPGQFEWSPLSPD